MNMVMQADTLLFFGVVFAGLQVVGLVVLTLLLRTIARSQAVATHLAISTHMLVNSEHGAALRLTATIAKAKADLTGAPDDVDAALLAERLATEHEARQRRADEWQGLVTKEAVPER